jgi:hypothetical protein
VDSYEDVSFCRLVAEPEFVDVKVGWQDVFCNRCLADQHMCELNR